MGSVWLAARTDGELQQTVAIKLLGLAGLRSVWRARFLRERQLLATLNHPSIVRLLDAGTDEGVPYLVMEYVEGQAIDVYATRLPVRDRLKLFLQVCDAVADAHRHLIVHRDLKPSNVLVDGSGRPKLLDFGIAKLLDDGEPGASALTIEGAAALTPAYAAPEQVTAQPITTATDIYALGVLLYVLLTGRHPAGEHLQSPADVVKAIVEVVPPRPSDVVTEKHRRSLRGDLDTIVGVALKKRPEDRFPSVVAFADDLRRYLRHEPITARRDSITYRAVKFVRRNRVPVAAAVAVVAALSAGLYTTNRQRVLAERRFTLVRGLSSKLFDIDVAIRSLSGNVAARQLIVDTSLDYLGQLAADATADPGLALE